LGGIPNLILLIPCYSSEAAKPVEKETQEREFAGFQGDPRMGVCRFPGRLRTGV